MSHTGCSGEQTLRICWTANIGTKWQIVIPKDIRDILSLQSGDSVSFILKDEKFLGIISNNSIEDLMDYVATEKNVTLIK